MVNQFFDYGISNNWWHFTYLALFVFPAGILIGAVSGIFPAKNIMKWVVPAFRKAGPNRLFSQKGQHPFIIFQFACTFILVIASMVIWLQIRHLKTQNLNFDEDHLISVYFAPGNFPDLPNPQERLQTVYHELNANPSIDNITMTQTIPGKYWHNYNTFRDKNKPENKMSLRQVNMTYDFFDKLDIDFIIEPVIDLETIGENDTIAILNQEAFKKFGWENINSKFLCGGAANQACDQNFQVIGVVENYHYQSLKNGLQPVIHFIFNREHLQYTNKWLIRLNPHDYEEGIEEVRKAYNALDPIKPFSYQFIDEVYDQMYKQQERLGTTAGAFSLVAVILAVFGMLSIASFTVKRRTKEIAIRKVNGARKGQIVGLFSKNFLVSVGIAFVIACPLAWYIMHDWLQDFAYRIQIEWWVFAVAGIIGVLITLGTVGVQSFRAALANPVDSLRDE